MQKVFYPLRFLSLSIIAMLITNNGTEFNNIVHSLTAITFIAGKIKLFKKNIFEFKLILLTKAII